MRTYKPAGIATLEKYGYVNIEPRFVFAVPSVKSNSKPSWAERYSGKLLFSCAHVTMISATMKSISHKRPTLRLFKATTPGGETVLVLRQAQNCWHVFGVAGWTGSGSDPKRAYCGGGLGDVIGTDSQMSAYKRWVRLAPMTWAGEFAGLWEAKQQVK